MKQIKKHRTFIALLAVYWSVAVLFSDSLGFIKSFLLLGVIAIGSLLLAAAIKLYHHRDSARG